MNEEARQLYISAIQVNIVSPPELQDIHELNQPQNKNNFQEGCSEHMEHLKLLIFPKQCSITIVFTRFALYYILQVVQRLFKVYKKIPMGFMQTLPFYRSNLGTLPFWG